TVTVKTDGGQLGVDWPQFEMQAGDAVLWHKDEATSHGYAVRGEVGGDSFSSAMFTDNTIFSHAFITPGEYRWTDAYHGHVSGVVQVNDAQSKTKDDIDTW